VSLIQGLNVVQYPFADVTAWVRPGTSDEDAMREVLVERCYSDRRSFDVEPEERWLDLGANVGAFMRYAASRGAAVVDCYEPDPECLPLLQLNATNLPVNLYRVAVTAERGQTLPFWKSKNPENHWRATAVPTEGYIEHPAGQLPNRRGSFLRDLDYDGVKIDIEGSEFGLIEQGFLPRCRKLVIEYHLSRQGGDLLRCRAHISQLLETFRTVTVSRSFWTGGVDPIFFFTA
jgi:FkbM family methyltransferase